MVHVPDRWDTGDTAPGWMANLSERYEIVREHGRGGMATVYLAIDRKHDRRVALKLLAPELTAGIGAERFLREIQIAAHLNHPHIVPLLDSGLADGRPYYVMPFVEGESVQERLARGGPLPIDAALQIARDVAEALVYAHGHDVVHRDVKPGNVLLTEGGAVVTDFGIAGALGELPEDHLTRTGLSVGTPGYMSPEQAAGDEVVDGRADQYGLACLLFEMLAGRQPFTGGNARAILSRQLTEAAPSLSEFRDSTPEAVEEVVRRGLAREPEERFATTEDLAAVLADLAHRAATGSSLRFRTRPAIWAALAVSVALAAVAWFLPGPRSNLASPEAVAGDTARYAVFPFENRAGPDGELEETTLLRAALKRWTDIDVVDGFQLEEEMLATGRDSLSPDVAAEVALREGAGRFIMGGIVRLPDSTIAVEATLYGATTGGANAIETRDGRLRDAGADVDSLFNDLATYLLWRGEPPDPAAMASGGVPGTRQLAAARAFDFGTRAVKDWDLAAADSGFSRALEWDPEYADAHLWRALVRSWSETNAARWRVSAEQAFRRARRLGERDAEMAEALVLQARESFEQACPLWDALTGRYPADFVTWYGLAVCLNMDGAVVGDRRSPTGWRFRSSRHLGVEAYQQAFRTLPSILESFRGDGYASLRHRLYLTASRPRSGYSLPDSAQFYGFPTWSGDTLAFWARPDSLAFGRVTAEEMEARMEAVRRQRQVFREIAGAWAGQAPRSSHAREALALALAFQQDPAALDTIRAARKLAGEGSASFGIIGTEIWLLVAFGLPDDASSLRRAKQLADSLLAFEAPPTFELTAGLAALTGRAHRAAREARYRPAGTIPGPPGLVPNLAALLAFATFGGPADSLDRLTRDIDRRIATTVPAGELHGLRAWLGLPASLAFATHPLPGRERSASDWLVAAQLAAERGDVAAARDSLLSRGTAVQNTHPFSRTLDALFAEASLWYALGEPDMVFDWVDPTLAVLPQIPWQIAQTDQVAALVRIAALRADAAAKLEHHRDAARWARAVTILWPDADPFLQPHVERMRRLAACESC